MALLLGPAGPSALVYLGAGVGRGHVEFRGRFVGVDFLLSPWGLVIHLGPDSKCHYCPLSHLTSPLTLTQRLAHAPWLALNSLCIPGWHHSSDTGLPEFLGWQTCASPSAQLCDMSLPLSLSQGCCLLSRRPPHHPPPPAKVPSAALVPTTPWVAGQEPAVVAARWG